MEDSKNRYRKVQKILRLTDRESAILNKKIQKSGYKTFQAFAFMMLFDGEVFFQDFAELNHLNYEIGKLGNNINQLARAANIYKQVSPDDVQELTDELEKLRELVEEKLNNLTRRKRD